MINLNTIKNIILFYYISDISINCFLVFFNLIFKVNINGILNKYVFKIEINIPLKYITSKFAMFLFSNITFKLGKF